MLFRVLWGASLQEDVKSPSHILKLCDGGDEPRATCVIKDRCDCGQCSPSMAAELLAGETWGSEHTLCVTPKWP